ncbi:barstar family protein [Streptomyces sp. NPDC003719]
MGHAIWWERHEVVVRVVPADSTLSVVRALPPTGLIHSARMGGKEMRDADGVFTQFHEALRLPDYFGWNWNALRDCLTDLLDQCRAFPRHHRRRRRRAVRECRRA